MYVASCNDRRHEASKKRDARADVPAEGPSGSAGMIHIDVKAFQNGQGPPLLRLSGRYIIKIGPAETPNGLTSGVSQDVLKYRSATSSNDRHLVFLVVCFLSARSYHIIIFTVNH